MKTYTITEGNITERKALIEELCLLAQTLEFSDDVRKTIQRAANTLNVQPVQEPAAWMVKFDARLGGARITDRLIVWRKNSAKEQVAEHLIQSIEPLYTHPQATTASGAIYGSTAGGLHNPAPQHVPETNFGNIADKRTPLTRAQMDNILERVGILANLSTLYEIVWAVEAAHGITGEQK